MNAVTETKIERTENKVLSFEEWGAKVRAAAAEVIAKNQAEKDEFARQKTLFEAFRL